MLHLPNSARLLNISTHPREATRVWMVFAGKFDGSKHSGNMYHEWLISSLLISIILRGVSSIASFFEGSFSDTPISTLYNVGVSVSASNEASVCPFWIFYCYCCIHGTELNRVLCAEQISLIVTFALGYPDLFWVSSLLRSRGCASSSTARAGGSFFQCLVGEFATLV